MSNESPLDFYSSSNKAKPKKNKASSSVAKPVGSKKSTKTPADTKRKDLPQMQEAKEIVRKIEAMNRDIAEKLDAIAKLSGKTPEEMEAYIQTSAGMTENDKQTLKKMKKDFAATIKGTTKEGEVSTFTKKTSRKEGRPTGDLRTKSIGSKKKWMPVK